jgi:hypothetical protein
MGAREILAAVTTMQNANGEKRALQANSGPAYHHREILADD